MGESYSREGNTNLNITDKANNFTNWMYNEITPYLQGNILEVGSGIGTYSQKIVDDFKENKIVLSDIDKEYVDLLSKKFEGTKSVSCYKIDLTKVEDIDQIKHPIQSAFALNVLEHIDDHVLALNNVYDKLESGGKFVILVPAHKFLFNCIDEAVGHYRRYTPTELKDTVAKTKFKIKKLRYFNFPGIVGWYLNGNILKKKEVSGGAMGFYNKVIPAVKIMEKYVLFNKIGLSLIAVLEKE